LVIFAETFWSQQHFGHLFHSCIKPAQVTSEHKHFCCPCPKWADFVYSLVLD